MSLWRWETKASRAPCADVPVAPVLLSTPPCPSHASLRLALLPIQELGVFTACSTQAPKIPLLLRMAHSELIIVCVFADIFEVWGLFCFFPAITLRLQTLNLSSRFLSQLQMSCGGLGLSRGG